MKARLEEIRNRIRKAAASCGREPESVRLVAVSKTHPADRVREAIEAGAAILGENYIQEAREKIEVLSGTGVSWHFIGHLQRNKSKYAVRLFDLIHSVDTLKLAREIDKQAAKLGKIQRVLIQVNISGETSKSGVETRECVDFVRAVAELDHLSVEGLMTMPPFFDQPERVRPFFRALRELGRTIGSHTALPGVSMKELSMGMTGDFEVAIQEGATLVRVGTAIFGERT